MAHNVEPIASHADIADILAKGLSGLAGLTPGERIRFQSVLVMSFRRMEAVYVHSELGSIDPELTRGFERSMLSMLHSPGAAEWWATAKVTFTRADQPSTRRNRGVVASCQQSQSLSEPVIGSGR